MSEPNVNPHAEKTRYLALLFVAPTIWALHFLLCYITAAIWCARFVGRDGALGPVRIAIVVYTVAACVAIGLIGWRGYQAHRHGGSTVPHDEDKPEDRSRFLGFATMLLAGLSAIATIYVAMAAAFVSTCQ